MRPARAASPPRAPALDARIVVPERGVDLTVRVPAGVTLALTGPNGAGKSTALAVIAGLLLPRGGHVRLGERDLTGLPAHQRRVVLLTQQPRLFPHLDVRGNILFPLRACGLSRRAARERARQQIEALGLTDLAARRPAQLSGGQAQRAAIARALAADPELILLDEPLSAIDREVAPQVREHLRAALAGRTAVIVTHHAADVQQLADDELALPAACTHLNPRSGRALT